MGKKTLILIMIWIIAPLTGYAQIDYILENLTPSGNIRFLPPSSPMYCALHTPDDSVRVIYFSIPPIVKPGMPIRVYVKWQFWTNHIPVIYANYFGNWQPNTELAKSQLYGGIPYPHQIFVDSFTFNAPTTPGWYRIRFMVRGWYDPVISFYGTPDRLPIAFCEVIFHVGYNIPVEEGNTFLSHYGYEISQNFPNPARNRTIIEYQIPIEGNVYLIIYNTAGQIINTLINGEKQKPGKYTIEWDCRDSAGNPVPSGSYFYTLKINGEVLTKKAIIVK